MKEYERIIKLCKASGIEFISLAKSIGINENELKDKIIKNALTPLQRELLGSCLGIKSI